MKNRITDCKCAVNGFTHSKTIDLWCSGISCQGY